MVMAFKGGDVTSGGHRKGTTSGFVGIAWYLIEAKKNSPNPHQRRDIAFGSNFQAEDAIDAAFQMRENSELNRRVKKDVYHFGFSLPKDRESNRALETLTPVQWEAVADRAVIELGLEAHQVFWILHHDDGHQHIHMVANRVPLGGGKAWRPDHDYRRLENVARWTEQSFGLRVYQSPERGPRQRQSPRQEQEPERITPELSRSPDRDLRPDPYFDDHDSIWCLHDANEEAFVPGFGTSFDLEPSGGNPGYSGGDEPFIPGFGTFSGMAPSGGDPGYSGEEDRLPFIPGAEGGPRSLEEEPFGLGDRERPDESFRDPGRLLIEPLTNFFPPEEMPEPPKSRLYRRPSRPWAGSMGSTREWRNDSGRPTKRSNKEFRALRASKVLTFWDDTAPAFRQALSWQDLGERLAAQVFHIEPATTHRNGLVLCYSNGTRKALSKVHPTLSGPKLAERYGESWETFLGRGVRISAPEPPVDEELTVDKLIRRIQAHHAVWTLDIAERHARPYPNGEQVVEKLQSYRHMVTLEDLDDGYEHNGRNMVVDLQNGGQYTTTYIMDLEDAVFEDCDVLDRQTGFSVGVSTTLDLGPDHRKLVRAATEDGGLFLIQGPPGSGKTTAAQAIVDSYQAAGYDAVGASVTGKAAQGLRDATTMDVRTIASWKKTWKKAQQGPAPERPSLILVDEASMLSLEDLQTLTRQAVHANSKLVLMGDVLQLPPVGAGDPFRRLQDDFGYFRLTEIHRQQVPWMRSVTKSLVDGGFLVAGTEPEQREQGRAEIEKAVATYHKQDRIHFLEDPEQALAALSLHWWETTHEQPERSAIMMAYRNEDAAALNTHVRALRRDRGELGESVAVFSKDFATGDRILFRRNEYRAVRSLVAKERPDGGERLEPGDPVAVYNGSLGDVTGVTPELIQVRLDSGAHIAFDPREYADVDYGYAVSIHKAQGITVDHAFFMADRHVHGNAFLVAASRHRHDLQIYVPQNRVKDVETLSDLASTFTAPDLVRDIVDINILSAGKRSEKAGGSWESEVDELMKVFARCRDVPPTIHQLKDAEARIDRLREGILPELAAGRADTVPATPGRQLDLARLTEKLDQYVRQHVAATAVEASVHGLDEQYLEAVERYRALPEPRFLPTPESLSLAADRRLSLPDRLPEPLAEKIRKLEDFAHTYHQASSHLNDTFFLADRNIDGNAFLVGASGHRTNIHIYVPRDQVAGPQDLTELASKFSPPDLIRDTLELHKEPAPDGMETFPRKLRRKMAPPKPATQEDVLHIRWWNRARAAEDRLKEARTVADVHALALKYLEEPEKLTPEQLAAWTDKAAETARHLESLTFLPLEPREAVAAFERQLDAGISTRQEGDLPETLRAAALLHRLDKLHVDMSETAGRIAEIDREISTDRTGFPASAEEQRNLREHFRRTALAVDRLPTRRKIMQNMAETGLRLPPEQRATLPQPVRAALSQIEAEHRASEARRLAQYHQALAEVGKLTGRVMLSQVGQMLLPRQVRKVVSLFNAVQGVRREGPQYLVHRLTPAPVKTAMSIVKTLQASPTEGRSPGRVQTQSRNRGYER